MKKPFSFRFQVKNEGMANGERFEKWTGYNPAVFHEPHKEFVAKSIVPEATKEQEKDYQLASLIRLKIRKATAVDSTEEEVCKALGLSLDLIEKLHNDLIGIRLTYEIIKICREKSLQIVLMDPEPAEWEVDEHIFEQISNVQHKPEKQLEYLLYLRMQASHLGIPTTRIDEEILRLDLPVRKEVGEANE